MWAGQSKSQKPHLKKTNNILKSVNVNYFLRVKDTHDFLLTQPPQRIVLHKILQFITFIPTAAEGYALTFIFLIVIGMDEACFYYRLDILSLRNLQNFLDVCEN